MFSGFVLDQRMQTQAVWVYCSIILFTLTFNYVISIILVLKNQLETNTEFSVNRLAKVQPEINETCNQNTSAVSQRKRSCTLQQESFVVSDQNLTIIQKETQHAFTLQQNNFQMDFRQFVNSRIKGQASHQSSKENQCDTQQQLKNERDYRQDEIDYTDINNIEEIIINEKSNPRKKILKKVAKPMIA
ncbi:UNKNOWN [Stylonychia lemnae]|uniref:Transmembrane protein n=1 Tax=Stylonychia lemnae TaxID=5949 RepID=A0A078BC59_STYLE|nr:UNKNOWN [Stylonychia lemnae]|eukprot:CDW91183.1 UNKNOWN [Stylonychia lemnae]